MKSLTDALPEFSKQLTEYTGIEIISRLGEHSVKEVINGILHGKNVRSLTEGLTRKRIASCSAGVLKSYISSSQSIENFLKMWSII